MSPPPFKHNALDQIDLPVRQAFSRVFDQPVDVVAVAPGRVNLIGEHVDYHDGVVLPLAINCYTTIAGRTKEKATSIRLYSTQLNELAEVELAKLKPEPNRWTNYVAGVVVGFVERGFQVPAFDAAIHSTVPAGAGLSSSAALTVATATMIESMIGQALAPTEKALLCQKAEHDFAGVPCGIMDQFASVFGQANHLIKLDCRSQHVQLIPFKTEEISILIFNSHAKHELGDGEYARRREQSKSALKKLGCSSYRDATLELLQDKADDLTRTEFKRARHVISEIDRTCKFAELIQAGQWNEAGDLLYASHDSLRDDYEVSCRELDLLVELAREIGTDRGMLGMRMTGAGFGGCTVSLVRADLKHDIIGRIQGRFETETQIRPDAFSTMPAAGTYLVGKPD